MSSRCFGRRKHRKNLSCSNFCDALLKKGASSGSGIVALAMLEYDQGQLAVAPLSASQLSWMLLGDSKRRATLHALQRYIPPRGGREAVLRADWRVNLSSLEMRTCGQPSHLDSFSTPSCVILRHAPYYCGKCSYMSSRNGLWCTALVLLYMRLHPLRHG